MLKKPKFYITTTVARSLWFFSGQANVWQNKFDVCAVAAEKENLISFAKEEGIGYKYIPMRRDISLISDVICLIRFVILFLKEKPTFVHGNTPKASMLSMLAAWLTCRPVRIYMCHGLRYETTTGMLLKVLKVMEWISCHCATQVIGVSQGVVDKLVAEGLCHKHKIKIVGYGTAGGIDVVKFSRSVIVNCQDVRESLNIPKDAFVFCFVGRIVKDKGINELVEAFDKLTQINTHVYLLLIGSDQGEIDPISLPTIDVINANERIFSLGRQDDVRPYIAASNALVLPSYREGVGQVILEANALDVPCIATDIIGPRDVIEPMVNGELVKPRSVDALFEKMRDWTEHPDKVADMAKLSRAFVEARYEQGKVREAYYNEYCKLAGL